MSEAEELRDRFWETRPWSGSIELVRVDTHVIPTRGRSGRWVLDEVELQFRSRKIRGLATYAPRLQPLGVKALAMRLTRAIRESLPHRFERRDPWPLVVVEVASEALLATCRAERLGVWDLRGSVDMETDESVIQIAGRREVLRPLRVSPTSPLGRRVSRTLLLTLHEPLPVARLARELKASYSSVWTSLMGLEKLGLIARRRGRPPRVLDPRALLKHWCETSPPPVREGWYCPNTTSHGLRDGMNRLKARGADGLFTYRSAMEDVEVHASALPHGVRSLASSPLLAEVFGLRPVTPQNFFVVRDELEPSGFGGPGMSPREVAAGAAVSLPQLVFDLHHLGGRARDQADALTDQWWKTLPARPLDD